VKIVDIRATPVAVPFVAPLRWSLGVCTHAVRTVIEVETDDGVVGIGETSGAEAAAAIDAYVAPLLRGQHPMPTMRLLQALGAGLNLPYTLPQSVFAAVEMACLDAVGRSFGVPVHSLLGGSVRDAVEVCAIVYYRHAAGATPDEVLDQEALCDRVGTLAATTTAPVLKLHGGVRHPREELDLLSLLQERTPGARWRLDPNGAWTVATARQVARLLPDSGVDIEYLEDPVAHLEGMAQVRRDSPVPLATNMCVTGFADLAPGIRLGSVDVVLADVHYWGGLRANQRMIAVCDAFQLGVGLHGHAELGVSLAAMVHLAAVSPSMTYAIDLQRFDLADDIVQETLPITGGRVPVPTAPGLGVELDRDAVERAHRRYLEQPTGDRIEDPRPAAWGVTIPVY